MKLSLRHIAMIPVGVIMLLTAVSPVLAGYEDIKKVSVDTMLSTPQEKYNYLFLEAVREQEAGHDSAAYGFLTRALDINPNAPEAYFMLSRYYIGQNNDSLAELNMEKAANLNPDNTTYLEGVAQYSIHKGDYDKAIDKYEQLYSKNHNRTDVLDILLQLYGQEKDYHKMLSVISREELVDGVSEQTILAKMNIYDQMDDKKAAYKALKSLSDENPTEIHYKVMLGNWLMQHKEEKEAYKIYVAALKEEPDNTYAQTSLYDYYRAKGDESLADTMLNNVLVNTNTPSNVRVDMLKQYIQENEQSGGDSVKVLNLLAKIMRTNPKDGDVADLNVAYMNMKNMPQDTIKAALRHALSISPDNAGDRLQLIQAEWPSKNWDEIISLCKPAIEYNPEQLAFYYFLGLSYYQKNDTDSALNAFKSGLEQITEQSDSGVVSDFYAMMGDLLQQKGLSNEAFTAYDSCLKWRSDNVECLNNYAYYLSEQNKDLSKAEEMSYKTIKAEPKNSTFLDTYAYILFTQKRYAEAKIYIDQAVTNDTDTVQSGVILEHAGDIYAMNNDADKAIEYWQKATKAGGGSALLERKIKLRKYIKK